MATSTLGSGTLVLAGTTSGTTTVTATAVAGTTTLTLPAATDTLVGKATTDTLTNKTLTGAAMNGTVGATTANTGAFTTLSATGAMSVGGATPTTSGAGITFPATQSASTNANTLDDYEEGTWTPTLVSTGGGAPAYTDQTGRYYKIGGVVYLFGTVTILGVFPSGNYTRIQGLPFGQTSAQSGVALKYSGATGVSSGEFITAAIGGGEISFSRNDGNGEIGVIGLNGSYISTIFSATFSTMYQAS